MAAVRMSVPSSVAVRAGVRSAKLALPVRKSVRALVVRAQASQEDVAFKFGTATALSTVASTWMMAGNATAATELASIAASDNRLGIIATLFVPALGWVAFNILGSLQAQLDQMSSKNGPVKKRAVPAAIGLGAAASLLAAQSAEASTELASIAASDNRLGIIATLFVPALGWVAFNILGSLQAQLDQMSAKNK